jgi:uncharacterized protein (DUF58 family)
VTVRPGPNAVRLSAALAAAASLTFLTVHAVWLLLALALVGVALALRDMTVLRTALRSARIVRKHPAVVPRGAPFEVSWTVHHLPLHFAAQGELREEVPTSARPRLVTAPLAFTTAGGPNGDRARGAESSRVVYAARSLCLPERGRFQLGPAWLRLSGPAGFLDAQQEFPGRGVIRVLPETFASPDRFRKDFGAEIRLLDKPVFTRLPGEGTEFESLKEFRSGDDPRRIDWRATARLQRPIVRRFQIERHRDVMILIDCGRLMGAQVEAVHALGAAGPTPDDEPPFPERGAQPLPRSKLDCAVDAALLLARVALHGGDRCGLALFDRAVRGYLPPVSGLASLGSIVDAAYDAQVEWAESDFSPLFATLQRRQSKRSLLVILSDVIDAETSSRFRESLRRLARRHVLVFAALRTPLLRGVVHQPIQSLEDAARQAVAFRLLHERDQALQTLRSGGVQVLDVEPQRLSAPLINEFIAIRRHNVL